MVLVSVRYSFSQRFSVPAKEAFEWAIDYHPDDFSIMGLKGKRTVKRLSPDTLLLDEERVERGKAVKKTKLIRLNPERLSYTNTHISGPTIHSQFWYEFLPEEGGGSRLDFTGLSLYSSKRRLSDAEVGRMAAEETRVDSQIWKNLAKAMESDLSK